MSMNVPVIITKTKGFWDYDTFENNRNIIFAEKNDIKLWESLIENLFKDKSLYGNLIMNAKKSLAAGCNIVLYCAGNISDNFKLIKSLPYIDNLTTKKTSEIYKVLR